MSQVASASGSGSEVSSGNAGYLYLICGLMLVLNVIIFVWMLVERSFRESDLQAARHIQAQLQQQNRQLHQEWMALTSPQKNRQLYQQKMGLVPAKHVVTLEELQM